MIHKVPARKRMPPRVWKHDTAILWVIFQIRAICVYCLLHSKVYTVYTQYCALCTIDDTHSVLCTLDTVYSVHYIPYMLYTVHSVQCSLYTVYPIYCKQWTQYIGQCAHYSLVDRVGRVKGTWIKKKVGCLQWFKMTKKWQGQSGARVEKDSLIPFWLIEQDQELK